MMMIVEPYPVIKGHMEKRKKKLDTKGSTRTGVLPGIWTEEDVAKL